MKRFVKLPAGAWVDVDLIESIEEEAINGGSVIYMASGRRHRVVNLNPAQIIHEMSEVLKTREL